MRVVSPTRKSSQCNAFAPCNPIEAKPTQPAQSSRCLRSAHLWLSTGGPISERPAQIGAPKPERLSILSCSRRQDPSQLESCPIESKRPSERPTGRWFGRGKSERGPRRLRSTRAQTTDERQDKQTLSVRGSGLACVHTCAPTAGFGGSATLGARVDT